MSRPSARLPDGTELQALLGRTIVPDADEAARARLAGYVVRAARDLEGQPLAELLEGRAAWPPALA